MAQVILTCKSCTPKNYYSLIFVLKCYFPKVLNSIYFFRFLKGIHWKSIILFQQRSCLPSTLLVKHLEIKFGLRRQNKISWSNNFVTFLWVWLVYIDDFTRRYNNGNGRGNYFPTEHCSTFPNTHDGNIRHRFVSQIFQVKPLSW